MKAFKQRGALFLIAGQIALLCSPLPAAASPSPSAGAQQNWYTLSVDGVRTGYALEERIAEATGSIERETMTVFARELGHISRIDRRIEVSRATDGKPLALAYEYSAGTVHTAWRGTVDYVGLHVRSQQTPRAPATAVPFASSADPSPDRTRRFAVLWTKQESSLSSSIFDPARLQISAVHAQIVEQTESDRDLIHVRATTESAGRAAAENIWFGADGAIVRIETEIFGAVMTWSPCRMDCDARVAEAMDPMERLVVRSPVDIPPSLKHKTIRYVVVRTDGAPPRLAHTFEQAVVVDGPRAILTICATCGDEALPVGSELSHYLAPNVWVRSDDTEIRSLALSTVSHAASADFRMRKLVELVKKQMRGRNDFLGYADAITALHTGSGDCTEFAVLLAAFARAQGIPTRIVAGVVYSGRFSGRKNVFSPHMWVQAWDGHRWKSYDAALDEFDSTHIALAVGDGDPQQLNSELTQSPLLRIVRAGVVRSR